MGSCKGLGGFRVTSHHEACNRVAECYAYLEVLHLYGSTCADQKGSGEECSELQRAYHADRPHFLLPQL